MHTRTHAHKLKKDRKHVYKQTFRITHEHTNTHPPKHSCRKAYALTHTRKHTHTIKHTHARTNGRTHKHARRHTHAPTHIHTHARTLVSSLFLCIASALEIWRGGGRKNTSGYTCQNFVARAPDSEPINQIVTTLKLHEN